MTPLAEVQLHRDEIMRLGVLHGARDIRIFGSVARGDATSESDLDLLVRMDESRSLLDLIGFEQDLSDLLDRPVDVVDETGLSPFVGPDILAGAIPL